MKNVTLLTYTLLLLFSVSCGVPQADFDKLKKENEKLKKEIAECELTPAEILEKANVYYDASDFTKSREKLKTLIAKYANSDEGKKGKRLLKRVENKILETARAQNDQDTEVEEEEKNEGLSEKEEKERKARQKKKEAAIAKMNKKYDINDDVTWYSDKSSTKLNTKNYIQAYIGKKEKKPWIGISINYFSKKKWLFIERIEIIADKKTFELEENTPGEFNSKEESGGKREWLDRVIKNEDMLMTKAIASSKIAKIRFVGKDDVSTRTISKNEKKAIKNVLEAYVALGGNIK
ncbi:hypothetical protein [Aquimarina sp. AD10]|uniref:hypothetical protein n=1 Tax=Aquimarina sp. AD10 TaxID=1714849 RepID=UPI0011C45DC3|nr:hypothetical protein [Aquimarina sp. AD10]